MQFMWRYGLFLIGAVCLLASPLVATSQTSIVSQQREDRDLSGSVEIQASIASVLSLEINSVAAAAKDNQGLNINFGHVDAFGINKSPAGKAQKASGQAGACYVSSVEFVAHVSGHDSARLEASLGGDSSEPLYGSLYLADEPRTNCRVNSLKKIPTRSKAFILEENIAPGSHTIKKNLVLYVTKAMLQGAKEGELLFTLSGE